MFISLWMKERMFWFEKGILFTRQSTNKLREERLLVKEQPHQPVLQEAVLGHSSTLAGFCTGDKCAGIFRRASKGHPAVCRCVSGPLLCKRRCVPSSALLVFQVDSLPLSAPHEPLTGVANRRLGDDRAGFPPQFPSKQHQMAIAFVFHRRKSKIQC